MEENASAERTIPESPTSGETASDNTNAEPKESATQPNDASQFAPNDAKDASKPEESASDSSGEPDASVNPPKEPEPPKPPSVNAGSLGNLDKTCQTRLPNVTLPGPAEGISFSLDGLGVPAENILPDEIDFDAARVRIGDGKIVVFPKLDGDHALRASIHTRDGKVFVTEFLLTVNPDPKSLWKDNPVPKNTPFVKPDCVAFHADDGNIRIVAASRRGRSHAQQGTCRDDDMAFWSDSATGRYVLVVADGAGSAKFSRQGSKIAVDTAVRELSEKLTDAVWESEGGDFTAEGNVGKVLVGAARAAVGEIDAFVKRTKSDETAEMPDLALKDFNTTLLMAVVKRYNDGSLRGAAFSIGDGAIAWWQPGKAKLLCAPDGGEFSGQTKFLTTLSVWKDDYAVIQKARCFTFQKSPQDAAAGRLFLMTDGVSDPFFETDNLLRSPAEWDKFESGEIAPRNLFANPGENEAEAASQRLLEWLSFWSVGNHDDRTIAVLGSAPVPPTPLDPNDRKEDGTADTPKTGFFGNLFGRKS